MNRTINATLYILIFAIACIIFGQLLAGCSVIEKLKHKEKRSEQVETREKIDSVGKSSVDSVGVSTKKAENETTIVIEYDSAGFLKVDTGWKYLDWKTAERPGYYQNPFEPVYIEGLLRHFQGPIKKVTISQKGTRETKDSVGHRQSAEAQVKKDNKGTYQRDEVLIHKQTTKKVVPLWVWIVLGVGVVYVVYRGYKFIRGLWFMPLPPVI